jgi:DNA-binding NtrC family response regulator
MRETVHKMGKVLIVDDDEDIRSILSDIIKSEGYKTIAAGDGRKALEKVREHSPEVVLLDVRLPEIDGMQVLKEIKKMNSDTVVIMLTAYGRLADAVQSVKMGAFDYITKPFDNEEVLSNIKKALHAVRLIEAADLRSVQDCRAAVQFIGESRPVKEVLNQVNIVSPTNMTVVLQGESGTGKELIARMIHQGSSRRDKPFIVVDGGTLPENLMESELFGYERGAFTGANEKKAGKFEAANGGTLFLDEITNLPYTLQSKMLRVLQERRVQHIGSSKEIRIDIRIIAATNTVLPDEVRKGRFREDLYHRLNEFYINIPPLRKREEDISLLARYYLGEANQEFNKKVESISGEAMKSLSSYQWPGNVRELKNVVKRAVLLTDSDAIREISFSASERPAPRIELNRDISMAEIIKKTSGDAETELIRKALVQTKNNKTKAARLLKIDRMTLYSKIKSLGL